MIQSPLLRVLLAMLVVGVCAPFSPPWLLQALYTFSCLVKDLLLLVIPPALACFLGSSLSAFGPRTPMVVLLIAGFEFCSNSFSSLLAWSVSWLQTGSEPISMSLESGLDAWWRLQPFIPSWWSAQWGVAVGILLGCLVAWGPLRGYAGWFQVGRSWYQKVLTYGFLPILPLFVAGFFADLWQRNLGGCLMQSCSWCLVALLGWLFVYLAILFGMATGFRWRGWSRAVLNCLPSGLMAATTMSSDATLPVTLAGAEKNLHDPEIARLLIPATVNIQMPGDCFINIFLAFSLIPLFGLTHPAPMQLIAFWFSFVLARFAAVGVTGGAIWLMIPLYEQYLGFTPAMTSLMISFNLLLDPIVTSSNVMGNGALAMLFERLLGHRVLSSGKPLVAR